MEKEKEMELNEGLSNPNEINELEEVKSIIESKRKKRRRFVNDGFYDTRYYDKLDLIDEILLFIQISFRKHYPPNELITLDLDVLYHLKEYIQTLFSYFNVLPPMQKKCLDKNLNDLIKNNVIKKSELNKKIYFIERDIKKAKYNLLSKKDLFDLLKQRGLE